MESEKDGKGRREIIILEGRLRLLVPDSFGRMGEAMVRKKFPYLQIPQEIFSDAEGDRIFACSILEKPLREGQVYPALLGIQKIINHAYPESIQEPARSIRIAAGMAGCFMFLTGGMKSDVCHYMYILPVDGKMLFGSYHFPVAEKAGGKQNFLEILRSMQLKKENKGEGMDNGGRREIHGQNHTGPETEIQGKPVGAAASR